jgi:hypothetical protein
MAKKGAGNTPHFSGALGQIPFLPPRYCHKGLLINDICSWHSRLKQSSIERMLPYVGLKAIKKIVLFELRGWKELREAYYELAAATTPPPHNTTRRGRLSTTVRLRNPATNCWVLGEVKPANLLPREAPHSHLWNFKRTASTEEQCHYIRSTSVFANATGSKNSQGTGWVPQISCRLDRERTRNLSMFYRNS